MKWRCTLLAMLLLLSGGVNAWAAADYTFYIVRPDGDQKLRVVKAIDNPSAEVEIPEEIRSPYIPITASGGYRYFTSAADAKNYSASQAVGSSALAPGTTYAAVSGTSIYVGYHYDANLRPSDLPKLDGATGYKISCTNNGTQRWLYANPSANTGQWSDEEVLDYNYLWLFKGGDPYNIRLLNVAYPGKEGFVTEMDSYQPLECNNKGVGSGSAFLIVGSPSDANGYNLAKYNKDDTFPRKLLAFLMDAKGWGADNENMRTNYGRNAPSGLNYRSVSPTSALTFKETLVAPKTFVVINKAGSEAIRVTKTFIGSLPATVTVPGEVRSPYITDDSRYRFYKNGNTAGARDFSDDNHYTTYEELDATIYVGYDFDQYSPVPAGLPKLDNKTEYYISAQTTGKFIKNGSTGQWVTETGDKSEKDEYKWRFGGNYDPYAITLYNVGNSRYAYTNQCGNSKDMWFSSALQEHCRFMMLGTTADGLYLACINGNQTVGEKQYLEFLVDATAVSTTKAATPLEEVFRTNNVMVGGGYSENIYTSAYEEGKLLFTPVKETVTVTYKVVNRNGKLAVTAKEEQAGGDQPQVPVAARSPLLTASAYHYYAADQVSVTGDTYELVAGATELTALPENDIELYVTYDVADQLAVDLQGSTPYNIKENDTAYLQGADGTTVNAKSSAADMLWAFLGNDPYDIAVVNYADKDNRETSGSRLVKAQRSAGAVSLTATAAEIEAAEVQTFYLTYLQGRDDEKNYVFAPLGNVVGANSADELYLQYTASGLTLVQSQAKDMTGDSWLQPMHYDFNYTYKVYSGVDGDDGQVAAQHVTHSAKVSLPRAIRSPLLLNYQYEDKDSGLPLTEGEILSWTDHTIKVTYDYSKKANRNPAFDVDLNGDYQYLLSDRANYRPYDPSSATNNLTLTGGSRSASKEPTELEKKGDAATSKQNLKWLFFGNDPYKVELRNANEDNWTDYVVAATTRSTDDNAYKQASSGRQLLQMVKKDSEDSYAVNRFAIVYDNDFEGNAYTTDADTPTDWHVALMAYGSTDDNANFVRSYVGNTGNNDGYDAYQNYVEIVKLPLDATTGDYFLMNNTVGTRRMGGTVFIWKAIQQRDYRFHFHFQGEDRTVTVKANVDDPIVYPASLPVPAVDCTYEYYSDADMETPVTLYPNGTETMDIYVKVSGYVSHQDITLIKPGDFDPETNENWYFLILARTDMNGESYKDMPVRTVSSEDNKVWYKGADMMALGYDFADLFSNTMKVSHLESRYADRVSLTDDYLWAFVGEDPFNVKIYNKKSGKYLTRSKAEIAHSKPVYMEDAGLPDYPDSWVLHEKFYKATDKPADPSRNDNSLFSIYCQGEDGSPYGMTSLQGGSVKSRPSTDHAKYNTEYGIENKGSESYFNFKAVPYSVTTYQGVTFKVTDASGTEVAEVTVNKDDKHYAVGDRVTTTESLFDTYGDDGFYNHDLPVELKRQFCDYTLYASAADLAADANSGDQTIGDGEEGQTVYVRYTVNATGQQVFMPQGVTPDSEAGKQYLFFMDSGTGKDATSNIISNHWRWSKTSVHNNSDDNLEINYPTTTPNRFNVDSPLPLKWFFRGDPYHARVYVADLPAKISNLAPTHRTNAFGMEELRYFVQFGNYCSVDDGYDTDTNTADDGFEWQMMPTRSTAPMSFALAFQQQRETTVEHGTDGTVTERKDGVYYYFCRDRNAKSTEKVGQPNQKSRSPKQLLLDYDLDNSLQYVMVGGKSVQLHVANTDNAVQTLIRPAKVEVSVYKESDLSTPVTQHEVSEYYGVGEKFQSLPANVRRKFCDYTLIDPSTKAALEGENAWYELTLPDYDGTTELCAKYHVHDDAPFSTPSGNDETLWTDESTTWFNMAINGNYAYFDRNYGGLDTGGKENEHIVKRYGGEIVPKDDIDRGADFKYRKGMKWAFVGDPYEFYIVNKRHRTFELENGYKQINPTVGYLAASLYACASDVTAAYNNVPGMVDSKGSEADKTATAYQMTHFTFMVNPQDADKSYYLSLSEPRKTGYAASYDNMKTGTAAGYYVLYSQAYTSSYTYGDNVTLRTVDKDLSATADGSTYDKPAKNESFDCIMNVYNGENKIVATTGWTEMPRNTTDATLVPTEIKRYGCNYKVWADATMTVNEIASYSAKTAQKNLNTWDGTGDGNKEVYLIEDGSTLFVTYTYDDKIYSSENELRWVNCYFKWDYARQTPAWRMTPHVRYVYKDEAGKVPGGDAGQTYDRYGDKWESYLKSDEAETKWGWMYSLDPTKSDKNYSGSAMNAATAYGNVMGEDARTALKTEDTEKYDGLKWALIGDPYEFQLKSYHRLDGDYTYDYLKTTNGLITQQREAAINNGAITDETPVDKKFKTELTAEEKQGFTYTYKVDADGKGYLALKDELRATSMLKVDDDTKLIGSVRSYVSFNRENAQTASAEVPNGYSYELKADDETPGVTYTKGTPYTVDDYETTYKDPTQTDEMNTFTYSEKQYPFTDEKGEDVQAKTWTYGELSDAEQHLVEVTNSSVPLMNQSPELVGAKEWYVEPMEEYAREVVFQLKIYQKGKENPDMPTVSAEYAKGDKEPYKLTLTDDEAYPQTLRDLSNASYYQFTPYTIKDYGVDNNLVLPWSYRRQYCDYYYKAVKVEEPATYDDKGNVLTWNDVTSTVLTSDVKKWYKRLDKIFADKRVTFDVYYKTQDAFRASTSADDAWWYDLSTQETADMEAMRMQFKYIDNIHTRSDDRATHYTDDWLWAIEGDPYGFRMHNRYAQSWNEVLRIPTMPVPVDVDAEVDPVTGEATYKGTFTTIAANPETRGSQLVMSTEAQGTTTVDDKTVVTNNEYFEMMVGNYGSNFLFHPLGAEIIDRYPAFFLTMFVFNSGTWPVQLNEMQDRNAKRNIAANWQLEALNADELLPYFERAGYVGALKPEVAEANKDLFAKLTPDDSGNITATRGDMKKAQALVHNKDNLVPLKRGYYRIKALSADALTAYEAGKTGMGGDRYLSGYLHESDLTQATRPRLSFWSSPEGQQGVSTVDKLPTGEYDETENTELLAVEYDPASIFYFENTSADVRVQAAADDEAKDAAAVAQENDRWQLSTQGIYVKGMTMETTKPSAEEDFLHFDGIGGTVFTMRNAIGDMKTGYLDHNPMTTRFAVSTSENNELHETSGIQDTKWLLQPVGTNDDTFHNEMPLRLKMNAWRGNSYASLYVPFDVTISSLPEGVTAYIGTKVYDSGNSDDEYGEFGKLVCEPVADMTYVPAGSPILFCANSESITSIPLGIHVDENNRPSEASITGNVLSGRYLSAKDDRTNIFTFGREKLNPSGRLTGRVGFYVRSASLRAQKLAHNRVFYVNSELAAKGITMFFEEPRQDITDAIETYGVDELQESNGRIDWEHAEIYDLQGRRVYRPTRGIYIANGRKVVKK